MSMTEQEARSKCPMGVNKCEECPRLMDDCDGNEKYFERNEEN